VKRVRNNKRNGFTLIELLIVIAVIGILAGVLIAVINPAQQRTKANQAVMRSNVSKACLAAVACISASSTAYCTNTAAELGINLTDDNPPGSVYVYNRDIPTGRLINITGTMDTCLVTCTPSVLGVRPVTVSGCLIQ